MIYDHLTVRQPIDRGWSGDKKYYAVDDMGREYLLRISASERYLRKLREFQQMERVAQLGIAMCLPIEFGRCDAGVYSIQSWIRGKDAEPIIRTLPEAAQYSYGLDAGRALKRIHTIPAPEDAEPWAVRFNQKIDRKIAMYGDCHLKYPHGERFIAYIEENRHLLSDRPQTYQHGDYHVGNMMIDEAGQLVIIDFERDDWGDPWEEFNRIVWCAQAAPLFASGMVDGYFGGTVPEEFWRLLALYISTNSLSSLPWAIAFGEGEIRVMLTQAEDILGWYDHMRTVVPTWYRHMARGSRP